MFAADVMTRDVVTVHADTTVREIAEILLAKGISGVPVVNAAGALVGIVSEGDLIHRVENDTERRRSWWLQMFGDRERLATDFIKSHACKASDMMTHRVVTVAPHTPLAEVSALLDKHRIKRVPVVDGEKIVGIVSRGNLLKALVRMSQTTPREETVSDTSLHDSVLAQLHANAWANAWQVNVEVKEGAVQLWGIVNSDAEKKAIRILAEMTPGVRSVTNNLVVQQLMTAQ
jgi:CBS-domain-containing membrane protein